MIYLSYPMISIKHVNRLCVLDCLVYDNLRNFDKICSCHLQGEEIVEQSSNPFSGIGSGSNEKFCSVLKAKGPDTSLYMLHYRQFKCDLGLHICLSCRWHV